MKLRKISEQAECKPLRLYVLLQTNRSGVGIDAEVMTNLLINAKLLLGQAFGRIPPDRCIEDWSDCAAFTLARLSKQPTRGLSDKWGHVQSMEPEVVRKFSDVVHAGKAVYPFPGAH